MKLSELVQKDLDLTGKFMTSSQGFVADIQELEHKAALWDKLCSEGCIDRQGIHFGFDVVTGNAEEGYQIYCERNQGVNKYNTLEEALNQIPEEEE